MSGDVPETLVDEFNLSSELFTGGSFRELDGFGPRGRHAFAQCTDGLALHVRVAQRDHMFHGVHATVDTEETTTHE